MLLQKMTDTLGAVARGKTILLAFSLGLALQFAVGQIQHSNAESPTTKVENSNSQKGTSVKVHSGQSQTPQKLSDMDAAINKLRGSASKLSLPLNMFEPWWKTMQRDPDAGWMLKNFDVMSSDLDRSWAFPVGIGAYIPRLDTTEQNNEIKITAEVPGIEENNLDVTVTDDSVTIKGDKKDEVTEGRDQAFHSIERSYGSFERSILLPCKVESAKAQATLKNGILTITVPKSAAVQSGGKKLTIHRQ